MFASQRVKPIIACQSLAGLLHALHFHGQEQLSGIRVAQFLECALNKNYLFYKQRKHRNAFKALLLPFEEGELKTFYSMLNIFIPKGVI